MRVVDGLMMCRGVEARTMDEHRLVSFSRFSFLPFQPFTPELQQLGIQGHEQAKVPPTWVSFSVRIHRVPAHR